MTTEQYITRTGRLITDLRNAHRAKCYRTAWHRQQQLIPLAMEIAGCTKEEATTKVKDYLLEQYDITLIQPKAMK